MLICSLGGYLDVLKYARKNGCPWEKKDCLRQASSKEMKAWIQRNKSKGLCF